MNHDNPHCTPGLAAYQSMMDKDHFLRIWNQERLRSFKHIHGNEVEIFCSHDVVEFEKLPGRSAEIPAGAIVSSGIINTSSKPSIED